MEYNMVVDSDLVDLSIPEKFLAYSDAYCNAAIALTNQMSSNSEKTTWSEAAVVLMLSAHSAELLMKGLLFQKDSSFKINSTHDLDRLFEMYRMELPESKYNFEMPFKSEYLGMSQAEVEIFKKQQKSPTPSVLYRYPSKTGSREWEGAFGFEAGSFLPILTKLSEDISRLKLCIT